MSDTIQLKRGTAATWTSVNPTLAVGELGYETDTLTYKIGNGTSDWNSLPYLTLNGTFIAQVFASFDAVTEPSAPATGFLTTYGKNVAGRNMFKIKGPSGLDTQLQPALFGNGIGIIFPNATTTFTALGTPSFTAVGTVSHPTLAAGGLRLSTRRAIVTSAATANSASELRISATQCWRGDAAGLGGFFYVTRFACSSSVAGQRLAIGLFSTTSALATTTSPSSLTSCVFVGNDAGDTNLQMMINDGSGTCTKVGLGASFPVPSGVNNAMYELVIFCAPNSAEMGYRITRLDTGVVTDGVFSSNLPPSTTFLAPHMYANNNGVAASVVLEFFRHYLESDY